MITSSSARRGPWNNLYMSEELYNDDNNADNN